MCKRAEHTYTFGLAEPATAMVALMPDGALALFAVQGRGEVLGRVVAIASRT